MTDTKAPERIWADSCRDEHGDQEWDTGAWGLSQDFDDDIEYIRADLYDDLLRSADEQARAVEDDLSVWPEIMTEGSELKSALAAYKQAKESTND